MVEELERHQKALQDDAADLMELCEKMERQNRKLARDEKVAPAALPASCLFIPSGLLHNPPAAQTKFSWQASEIEPVTRTHELQEPLSGSDMKICNQFASSSRALWN